jgi:hypothetical protein
MSNKQKEHATSTEELVAKYNKTTNPVTRSVLRDIIINRLGINEMYEFIAKQERLEARRYMRKLTYSFESRSKMEAFFDKLI